jgi:hypothetical protein
LKQAREHDNEIQPIPAITKVAAWLHPKAHRNDFEATLHGEKHGKYNFRFLNDVVTHRQLRIGGKVRLVNSTG